MDGDPGAAAGREGKEEKKRKQESSERYGQASNVDAVDGEAEI